MNSSGGQVMVSTLEDKEQAVRDEPLRDGHVIYNGPVYNIGEASNSNFGVNYGSMSQCISHGVLSGGPPHMMARADALSLLTPILDASHTRNMKRSPPNSQCLPGTRREVIDDIQTWADSDDFKANPHILWIFGYAGCGKSAIAHAIAKHYANENRLAACFVFFRGSGDRSTAARFATTVASQVAAAIPETKPFIRSAIERNIGLLSTDTASLSEQFEHLVFHPIHSIASKLPAPAIVVLDGADECQDRDDMSTLIEDTIRFFKDHPSTPVRLLIASRVEDHLHQVLHSSRQVKLLDLAEKTSDDDIAVALDVLITNSKRGRRFARDEDWPDSLQRDRLVHHVGGNFLFMSLIIDRISNPHLRDGRTPRDRLALALSQNTELDDLYAQILTPCQELPHFHAVISTIALAFEPLCVVQLAELLNITTVNVLDVLIDLQAIMQLPDNDRIPITLWHTSLRDFLCTKHRSGPFYAKPQHHLRLAYRDMDSQFPLTGETSSKYIRRFALDHLEKYLQELDETERMKDAAQFKGPIFSNGQTALEVASLRGKWEVVQALVNTGVEVNIRFNEPRSGALCALHAACSDLAFETIYFLLDRGADPNIVRPNRDSSQSDYGTPLAFAALNRDFKLATRLLECNADPNLQGGYWSTALLAACSKGSLEIVELLLDHGADPTLRYVSMWSHLHSCAWFGHETCALSLLKREGDPNLQDDYGDTPLHLACERGHAKVTICLLKHKADASMKNKKGETALNIAQKCGHKDVEGILQLHRIEE